VRQAAQAHEEEARRRSALIAEVEHLIEAAKASSLSGSHSALSAGPI
jgi:hypothetical protein